MSTEETRLRPDAGGYVAPGAAPAATGPGYGSGGYGDAGDSGARETARQAKQEATERASEVAETAKQEAASVVAEGRQQAADLLAQLRTQVDTQVGAQRDRAVEALRSLHGELGGMAGAGEGDGPAHQLIRELAQRSAAVADWLDGRGGGDLAAELRSYARRKPGTFLLGSALLGVLAGRLTRGAVAASGEEPAAPGTPSLTPAAVPAAVPADPAAPGFGAGYGPPTEPDTRLTGPAGPATTPDSVLGGDYRRD